MKYVTIDEVISSFDADCPNQYTREQKISWLNELDTQIFENIIKTRVSPDLEHFGGWDNDTHTWVGYDDDTDGDTTLIVPFIYKDVYRYWLEKSVDYNNREIGAFNNAMQMYQTYYDSYFGWYNRGHRVARRKFIKI